MKYPCKDCEERRVGCHGNCERYQNAMKSNKEEKEKQRVVDDYLNYKRSASKNMKAGKR